MFILLAGPKGLFPSLLFIVYATAEISFMLWLLIKGASVAPTENLKRAGGKARLRT